MSTIIFLTQCDKKNERVEITQKISVELPVNYKTKQVLHPRESNIYGAMINKDEIFIAKIIETGIDTLSMEEKKKSILINIQGYMKPFNGSKLEHSEKEVGEILQSDFNFEFDKNGTSFMIFGKMIWQDTNIITLSFKTINPVSSSSTKSKDRLFKSVKYKY